MLDNIPVIFTSTNFGNDLLNDLVYNDMLHVATNTHAITGANVPMKANTTKRLFLPPIELHYT